jgi:arabinan endo-1,5-alpha-L-arabinosidase
VTGGLYLDDLGHTANGSTIGQWGNSASFNQQWMVVPVGSYYKIVNRGSGKCLDTGGLNSNGAILQQWSSGTSNNQQWTIQ